MFVDYAVEPFYYEKGINFYEDGQNYAMASLLSVAGQTTLGQPAFDGNPRVFPSRGQREDAGSSERSRLFCASDEVARISGGSWTARARSQPLECLSAVANPGVEHRRGLGGIAVPDQPNGSDGRRPVSGRARSIQEPAHLPRSSATIHRSRPGNRVSPDPRSPPSNFRSSLSEVTQVDSKTSPAVQLADVMIGAAIEAANNLAGLRSGGPDPEAVMSLYADHQFIHMIPVDRLRRAATIPPEGTQAADVIDYFSANFFTPRGN